MNQFEHINDLVVKIKASNDWDALDLLYDYYKPLIYAAIKKIKRKYLENLFCSDEDLLIESRLLLRELVLEYNSELSYFTYFLMQRFYYNLISVVKKHLNQDIQFIDENTYDPFDKMFESQSLHLAINELPKDLKQAITLYYFKDLNQTECASIMNINQPAFSKKITKALNILKKNIKME